MNSNTPRHILTSKNTLFLSAATLLGLFAGASLFTKDASAVGNDFSNNTMIVANGANKKNQLQSNTEDRSFAGNKLTFLKGCVGALMLATAGISGAGMNQVSGQSTEVSNNKFGTCPAQLNATIVERNQKGGLTNLSPEEYQFGYDAINNPDPHIVKMFEDSDSFTDSTEHNGNSKNSPKDIKLTMSAVEEPCDGILIEANVQMCEDITPPQDGLFRVCINYLSRVCFQDQEQP